MGDVDFVPDSTLHQPVGRPALPSSPSDRSPPTSPTTRHVNSSYMAPESERATLKPGPRWAGNATYGRKDASTAGVVDDNMDTTTTIANSSPRLLQASSSAEFLQSGESIVGNDSLRTEVDEEGDEEQEEDDEKGTGKDIFGIWGMLKGVDEAFDDYEGEGAGDAGPKVGTQTSSVSNEMDSSTKPSEDVTTLSSPRARNLHLTSSLTTLPASATTNSPPPLRSPRRKPRRSVTTLESASEPPSDNEGPSNAATHRPLKKRILESDDDEDERPALSIEPRKPKPSESPESDPPPFGVDDLFDSPVKGKKARVSSPPTSPGGDGPSDISMSPEKERKKGGRKSSTKIRAPSKKERLETQKESARLQAARRVLLPEVEQPPLTIGDLFSKINVAAFKPGSRAGPATSDPIITSSQVRVSHERRAGPSATSRLPLQSLPSPLRLSAPNFGPAKTPLRATGKEIMRGVSILSLEQDEDFPEMDDIFAQDKARRDEEEAKKRVQALREKKLKILQEQAAKAVPPPASESDDDELEIEGVLAGPSNPPRSTVKARKSGIPSTFLQGKHHVPVTDSQVAVAAQQDAFGLRHSAPARKSQPSKSGRKSGPVKVDAQSLEENLRAKVFAQSTAIRVEKDQEWMARGGVSGRQRQLSARQPLTADEADERAKWLQKGLEMKSAVGMDGEEEGDGDGDYMDDGEEYRGSASPRGSPAPPSEDDDKESAQPRDDERPRSASRAATEDEDKENDVAEDKENLPPAVDTLPTPSSAADENEEDKENAPPQRAFAPRVVDDDDDGDDLPVIVPRRSALRRVVFDDDEDDVQRTPKRTPQQTKVTQPKAVVFDEDSDEEMAPRPKGLNFGASPAKVLFQGGDGSLGQEFDLANADGQEEGEGFSQLFNLSAAPNGFEALRRQAGGLDDLDLESQKILPSVKINTQEMNMDNAIFEKDQVLRAEMEREERMRVKAFEPKQYLNEDGFFTQTKPATQFSPMIDRVPVSLTPTVIDSRSVSQADAFPATQDTDAPLRRLRRGPLSPSPSSPPARTLSPAVLPPLPRNAFDVLRAAANRPKVPKVKRNKDQIKEINAAFVQGEAEESDEELFGFGGAKEDDQEEDDDADKHVEGLVDDAVMDAKAVNEAAVMEKVLEQKAVDDAEIQKLHEMATKGELRGRKRDRGVGLGDSDSDEEEDEAGRKRRRSMWKLQRKVQGDQLEDLATNTRTVAFYNAYQSGIAPDDDNDFGFPSSDAVDAPEDALMDEEDDEETQEMVEEVDEQPKTVSREELRRELRAAVENGETAIDVDDVSWVDRHVDEDDVDMEPLPRVKEVAGSKKPAYRGFGTTAVDADARREREQLARLSSFKGVLTRDDRGSSSYGTAKAGSAVTGHKAKSKTPSTSAKSSQSSRSSLAKNRSVLSSTLSAKKNAFAE